MVETVQQNSGAGAATFNGVGAADNPMGLQQFDDQQPTQRASHTLVERGKLKDKVSGFFQRHLHRSATTPNTLAQSNNNLAAAPRAVDAAPRQSGSPDIRTSGGTSSSSQSPQTTTEVGESSTSRQSNAASRSNNLPPPDQGQAAAQPHSTIALSPAGSASFHNFQPAVLGEVLKNNLGRPAQSYQAQFSSGESQDHLLLEQQGHVLHLKQTPASVIAVRSSQTEGTARTPGQTISMTKQEQGDATFAQMGNSQHNLETLGRSHEGYLTGAHRDNTGETRRLHQDKLYALDRSSASWVPFHTDESFSQIAVQSNGRLFGQAGEKLQDLTSQQTPSVTVPKLKAFSVNPSSHAVTLSGDKSQTLQLFDFNQKSPSLAANKTLSLNGGSAEPKSVGFSHDRLFISDTEGRLYSARYEDMKNPSAHLELMPEEHFHPAGERWGGDKKVTGFLSGDNGNVHALVTDRLGNIHAHALDVNSKHVKGGWNLSDAMVVINNSGLLPANVDQANTLNLARLGRVGLDDGQVKRWDSTQQDWKDTDIKDVRQLQRGMDGRAYVLHDGTVKKLDITPKNNQFTLDGNTALNRSPSSNTVALGDKLPALGDRTVKAFVVLNDKEYVVLDDQNRLTAFHKKGKPTEVAHFDLEISHLVLDENHHLVAETAHGDLYWMNKENWQSEEARPNATWSQLRTPENRPLKDVRIGEDNTLTASYRDNRPGDTPIQIKNGHWKEAPSPKPADQDAAGDLFNRLHGAEHVKRIPGTDLAARVTTDWMGRGSTGDNVMSTRKEFLNAHVFKPTMEPPRFMKNIAYSIQHHHQGRDGLAQVYRQETEAFHRMEDIIGQPRNPVDLKTRIENLDPPGTKGASLKSELEAFRNELEDNTHRALRHLGEQYGKSTLLHQKEGVLNVQGEPSTGSHRLRIKTKLDHAAQKVDFKSSRHDLLTEVHQAIENVAPSATNPAGRLITTLQSNDVKISHQKDHMPMGERRDRGDDQALTKARLALDVATLKDLDHLINRVAFAADDQNQVEPLQKALRQLRDKDYGENQVKVVTDAGFTDHKGLEAYYDANKSFLNGFKKQDHATYTNYRSGTGSKTRDETEDHLKAQLKALQPGDSIALQRGYGANLSTPYVGLDNMPLGPFPSVGVAGTRNYNFSAERSEKGVTITLQREGGGAVGAGVGVSKNFLPDLLNRTEVQTTFGNRTFKPELRLGADVSAAVSNTHRNGLTMTLPDEEIDHFVHGLFNGSLDVVDLMKKSQDHATQKGWLFAVDINAGASAEARIGQGLSVEGSAPWSASARAGVAATVSVNLLNYTKQTTETHSNKGEKVADSQNRPRAFNSGATSIAAKAHLVGYHENASSATAPGGQGTALSLGGAAMVTVDNKTTKTVNLSFKEAEPPTLESLDKLGKLLGTAFKDLTTQQYLARLNIATSQNNLNLDSKTLQNNHLQSLHNHFAHKVAGSDEQYASLRALKHATVEQQASVRKHSLLDSGTFESTYTNLSRLDQRSAMTVVMSKISSLHSSSNAERISELLEQDPTLNALVKEMQATPGTMAKVHLELKDAVRDRIDEGSRDNTLSQKEVVALLVDRNNMRIKDITVVHSAGKQERFTSPLPLISGTSSASLNVTKTLGAINFSYGRDQDRPNAYTISGEMAKPTAMDKATASALKNAGLAFKS